MRNRSSLFNHHQNVNLSSEEKAIRLLKAVQRRAENKKLNEVAAYATLAVGGLAWIVNTYVTRSNNKERAICIPVQDPDAVNTIFYCNLKDESLFTSSAISLASTVLCVNSLISWFRKDYSNKLVTDYLTSAETVQLNQLLQSIIGQTITINNNTFRKLIEELNVPVLAFSANGRIEVNEEQDDDIPYIKSILKVD